MRSSELISSNRIESLAERLRERLFKKGSRPFERRMIVVPNEELKGYLFHYFARQLDVAAGMHIFTLPQSFAELYGASCRTKRIPSFLELSLFLEAVIATDSEGTCSFPDLAEYVSDSSFRLGSLCDQLSRLFSRYGLHGSDFLPKWTQEKGWQQWLWDKTFSKNTPWTYSVEPIFCNCQIHVFGFSFLPAAYRSFFEQLGACFYQFSPCAQFWEDLSSDQENLRMLRRFERQGARMVDVDAWKRFAPEAHPLLANWGKLGRELMRQFDLDMEQCFIEPQGNTLLASIQKDVLQMQVVQRPDLIADSSIQVHSAPTKLREIEVLYNTLCDLIHKNPDLLPRDMLILSADITAYAPLIHMVFGSQESQLSYSIQGLQGGGQNDLIQAFKHLLKLSHSHFAVEEVMKLFDFRCVMQRLGFAVEEVSRLRRWVAQAHIRWGWEGEESGTWMEGLDRLLLGLAMVVPDDQGELSLFPCSVVDLTEIELLEKWMEVLRLLYLDLQLLSDPEPRAIGAWLACFQEFGERYLTQTASSEPFFLQLKQLESQLSFVEQKCFTFASIQRIVSHLESSMRTTCAAPHLEKVTFASLGKGLIQPARVMWLLGMDEVSFPRSDPSLSLCALSQSGSCGYIPKAIDEDRYSFLSALCLATDHFIVSYERMSAEDHKSQGPSVLVQELVQCVQRDYRIDPQELTVHHPSLSFDSTYFAGTPGKQSYIPSHFAAAQCYYGPLKPLESFAPSPLALPGPDNPTLFELKKLSLLARNPIRFFLQQTLGIYMPFEEVEHEEFVVSPLLKSRVRKRALHGGLEEYVRALKAQGALPLKAFYPAALNYILEEATAVQMYLQRHQLDTEPLLTVELSLACKEPILRSEGHWIVPALRVPLKEGREGVIVGKLDHLSKQAILFDGKEGYADAVKYWPQFLIYHNLPLFSNEGEKKALFTRQGKLKVGSLEDPLRELAHYLAYYERACQEFSWLMPDWAECLLCGDEVEFAQALKGVGESNGSFYDAYVLWLKRRQALPNPATVLSAWKEDFQMVFHPMQSLWNLKMRGHAEV